MSDWPDNPRVIVTGGRNYQDRARVNEVLVSLWPSLVVSGDATGADALAEAWCKEQGAPYAEMKAWWRFYGRGAGPIRNGWMADLMSPDLVIAFPGNRGTSNMVDQARKRGIPVMDLRRR